VTRPAARDVLDESEVAFLLCVEANRLEPQARLLCESIRTHGGRYRNAPIVAVSPRTGLALGCAGRAALAALDVQYVAEPLNHTASAYGTINRIVAGAWAEEHVDRPYLVVLDTDTVFVEEPGFPRVDAGVRPVDVKGSASSGDGDPLDRYWTRLCRLAGIAPSALPTVATTIDDVRIRASYNGGLTVVRRDLGILRQTADVFMRSIAEDLRPRRGTTDDVFASTGFVGREASEWWGSSQAALSVGIWSRTSDVRVLDARYNVPLHLLLRSEPSWPTGPGFAPILLHYHYLAEAEYRAQFARAMRRIGCAAGVCGWVEERLDLFLT
jgi:hypothetical protein